MTATLFSDLVSAMLRSDFYPHPSSGIEMRETHISVVFLTGKYVYKIKKAVNLQFLDFSELEKRRLYCWAEFTLNQRLSSDVYLEVIPITQSEHGFELDGTGTTVEYAVKMRQLPDAERLDKRLRSGRIDPAEIRQLAQKLARFYKQADSNESIARLGDVGVVRKNCEENFEQIEPLDQDKIITGNIFQIIRSATRAFLNRHGHLFELRIKKGKIRDCHGDLKCEHIYLGDPIQIIDCIEFNDRFRFGDISADLAFLTMDMDFRGKPESTQILMDEFLKCYDDPELLVLLPFYKCYRAMVRVKIALFQMQPLSANAHDRHRLELEAQRHLKLAYRYAGQFTRPTVWVVCGLPASGKSTLAAALSLALDIPVISSDITRKALFQRQPRSSGAEAFGSGIYSETATALTYGKILLLAQERVQKGESLIIDATYAKNAHRAELLRFARDMDLNLMFIHCEASRKALRQRLRARESHPGVSDAREHHLEDFTKQFDSFENMEGLSHIEVQTEAPVEENLKQILLQDTAIASGLIKGPGKK